MGPFHSLTEVYSVLTRTPVKPPIYPSEAWQIIEEIILPHMELVRSARKSIEKVFAPVPPMGGPEAGFMMLSTCAALKKLDAICGICDTSSKA